MSRWMKSIGRTVAAKSSAAVEAVQESCASAGEYQSLYTYLRDRYANRVTLTFGEIEDLLGFQLPEPARMQVEWWTPAEPTTPRSPQSDSWILASRTATVNLKAQVVLFERESALDTNRRK